MAMAAPKVLAFAISIWLPLCFTTEGALSHLRARSHRRLETSNDKATKEEDDDDDDADDDGDDDSSDAPVYNVKNGKDQGKVYKENGDEKESGPHAAAQTKFLEKEKKHEEESPHAADEAKLENKIKIMEEDLSANLQQQSALKKRVSFYLNEDASDREIDADAKLVANETESAAMADMLAKMWKEMRMFEVPSYAEYVDEELRKLKLEERRLEQELVAEQATLVEARKKWELEDKQEKTAKEKEVQEEKAAKEKEVQEEKAAKEKEVQAEEVNAETRKADERAGEADKGAAVTPKPSSGGSIFGHNFWTMHREQQTRILEYSFAYMILGILFAFLYRKASGRYPTVFNAASSGKPNNRKFTHGLCSWYQDWPIALLGCCCPCLRWAHTLDNAYQRSRRKAFLPYAQAFAIMFLLMLINPYTGGFSYLAIVAVGVIFRQQLRKHYEIDVGNTTILLDIAAWCCCTPCAICQEAREEAVLRET